MAMVTQRAGISSACVRVQTAHRNKGRTTKADAQCAHRISCVRDAAKRFLRFHKSQAATRREIAPESRFGMKNQYSNSDGSTSPNGAIRIIRYAVAIATPTPMSTSQSQREFEDSLPATAPASDCCSLESVTPEFPAISRLFSILSISSNPRSPSVDPPRQRRR